MEERSTPSTSNRVRLYFNTFIRNIITFSISAGIMLLAAGRINWMDAIWFWFVYFLISLTAGLILVCVNYSLMKERQDAVFKQDVKSWDRWILAVNMILTTGLYILVGLDAGRYGWSHVPLFLRIVGGALILVSFAITLWATHENKFLSSQVRIQEERGHNVVSTGPYAVIRHPMYAGYCLLYIGLPLALNSWWGLTVSLALMVVIIIRTRLEDITLHNELPGYSDYSNRIRFRLIPGVW
jgi:protein-S-isoprenylcysteine O-methyltransferase Ste14